MLGRVFQDAARARGDSADLPVVDEALTLALRA